MGPGMRQRECGRVHAQVVVGDDIHVERSRPPAHITGAPGPRLAGLRECEHRKRGQVGVGSDGRVEERRLFDTTPRCGLVDGGNPHPGELLAHRVEHGLQRRPAVAEIRTDAQHDARHGYRERVIETLTSRKSTAIGACGLCTVTRTHFTRSSLSRSRAMSSATVSMRLRGSLTMCA